MQQAALYRRERQTGEVKAVLLFVVRLRKSARSAGESAVKSARRATSNKVKHRAM